MNKLRTTLNIEKAKHQQAIMRGIWQPSRLDWKEVIEDYLVISRKRYNNKLSMFFLQKDLLLQVDSQQKNVRMFNDVLRNPENVKKYNPDFVPENKEDLKKESERQLEETKLLLKCLKEISDGHIWRMFKFNYSLLYFLGMHPSSGNLDPGPAFYNEFMHWGNSILNTDIKQFILCDLTNYARIGDLIIVDEDDGIEVQEIKMGKSKHGRDRRSRLSRQEEKRKQFEDLANKGETIFEGKKFKILNTDVPFETSLNTLEEIMKESENTTISGRQVYPYLSLVCIDFSDSDKIKSIEDIYGIIDNYNKPQEKDDIIWPLFSYHRSVYSPNLVPFSVYPISEEFITDLMFSKKIILYSLNVSEFYRQIESKGWKITKNIKDFKNGDDLDSFCHIYKNGLTIPVTWPLINNIIFETLKVENLIYLYNEMYKLVEKKNDILYFPNFLRNDIFWV